MKYYFPMESERDRLTGFFLPENAYMRDKLSREQLDSFAKKLLGADEIEKRGIWGENTPEQLVYYKESDFYTINFRYARIFDLCRVIGAANIYDIGCWTLNQSFQLVKYTTMSYTGIHNGKFMINDFRTEDRETKNYNIITAEGTPPPLCDGRIRCIHGQYPHFDLDVKPNNIAVACYSLTMYRDKEGISEMVSALTRDFERVLFNVRYSQSDVLNLWKSMDWKDFRFYPVGPERFVFGTRNPEDIEKLKAAYPYSNGHFNTGIDNGWNHWLCGNLGGEYADWGDEIEDDPEDENIRKYTQLEREAFALCQQKIAEHGLDLTVISASYDGGVMFLTCSSADEQVDTEPLRNELQDALKMPVGIWQNS